MQQRTDAADEPQRKRGRPPKSSTEPEHPGLAVENPLSTLSPTARYILETARRLLIERGFSALTIENISLEANETKASVTKHFGGKAGLIETLFDSLVHDTYVALVAAVDELPPGEERVGAYIAGLRTIAEDVDAYRAFFQIAPHALRDPELRPRMARLYEWYREVTLRACGVVLPDDPQVRRRLLATAGLVLAAIDGLALQVALDPAGIDDEYAFEVLRPAVQHALAQDGAPPGAGEAPPAQ
jgi:AcrR family transcriptional regulator